MTSAGIQEALRTKAGDHGQIFDKSAYILIRAPFQLGREGLVKL
jgi:hypothetical protein